MRKERKAEEEDKKRKLGIWKGKYRKWRKRKRERRKRRQEEIRWEESRKESIEC